MLIAFVVIGQASISIAPTLGSKMRRSFLACAAAVSAAMAIALPASADDTTTTFTITAGTLDITVPGTSNLGSVATGAANVSAQLGSVSVADERGGLEAAWTATVSSTTFTTGGATAPETVAASAVNYSAGAATSTTGTATFTPGTAGSLASPRTAFSASAITGNNTAAWNPTITITLGAQAVAGTYTGTITHSVA